MIQKAEEARGQHKVKNMADCLATENSWRLSENFERNCIERNQISLEGHINFSLEMKSATSEDLNGYFGNKYESKDRKVLKETSTGLQKFKT
jgi:hypothetical protein